MRRHNFAPWKPLVLASALTLLTIIGALTAIGVLTGPGDSSPTRSDATVAVLERTAVPTSSPHPTSFLIEPQISGEAITGSDRIATPSPTPEPTPQPTPEPAPKPAVDPAVRAPAAVYPVATPVPPPPPTPTPVPGGYRPDLSDQLYGLLNNVRTANGLQAVSHNDSLVSSAQFYTQYIFVDGNPYHLDHWLVGGPGDRAWARGYCCAVGEILVESEGSAQSMVDLWMSSAPHRSVILDPQYKSFGIACYGGPYVGDDGITNNPVVCSAEFGSG